MANNHFGYSKFPSSNSDCIQRTDPPRTIDTRDALSRFAIMISSRDGLHSCSFEHVQTTHNWGGSSRNWFDLRESHEQLLNLLLLVRLRQAGWFHGFYYPMHHACRVLHRTRVAENLTSWWVRQPWQVLALYSRCLAVQTWGRKCKPFLRRWVCYESTRRRSLAFAWPFGWSLR